MDRASAEAILAGGPVREFRWYRGRRHYSGWYWSATLSRLVAYESRLELARILLADFDPSVVGIAAQPFQLVGQDGDRVRRHVPDLLLCSDSGLVTVVDVKPRHRLNDPDVAAVFAWTRRVVASRGWAFEVWSGADAVLLANVRFIAGYRRPATIDQRLLPVAVELARQHRTIGALVRALQVEAGRGGGPSRGVASVVDGPVGRGLDQASGGRDTTSDDGGCWPVSGDRVIALAPGARLLFDGDLVEVLELEGTRVTLRNTRTQTTVAVGLTRLVTAASAVVGEVDDVDGFSVGVTLAGLSVDQRRELAERAGHVREVLTGFRSGHAHRAAPGEPDARFLSEVALKARYAAKAAQLGVTARTVERWVAAYRAAGEPGLIDQRGGSSPATDARWDEAVRQVLAASVAASTPTRGAVLTRVSAWLDEQHGPGVVPLPSQATAYRRLAELTRGTNAVSGSAKARRSIAERPKGVYGRLRASRPGEFLVLDTQDLDVFAMEPVTCRWVRVQLTVAQDLFTRCIVGLRVTPVSTKAVDVAGVLHEAVAGCPAPPSWPAEAVWPYHGVPAHVVFGENKQPAGPVCAPETLIVDHGKVFLSAHVISVCTRLGISIQPAQPHKPTDKPTVERFFRTLREGLIQHLPAYKGPDLHSRGDRVEDEAFLFVHELQDVIREWVAVVYHRAKHDGLAVASWPGLKLSPVEMFGVGIAKAGMLRIPATPQLALDFLPVVARTIQHYGLEINGLRYNGAALNGYRNTSSPYGGALAGKWPIRFNPDDVRHVWFQDPADRCWHRLEWEHAAELDTPFSAEAATHARRLAVASGAAPDPAKALAGLLQRWDTGMVSDRRERRIAARLSAEYAALPTAAAPASSGLRPQPPVVAEPVLAGDDDAGDELDEDFYDDAFEVLA